jgi:uncharacterized OsmC-like protein
MNGGVRTRSCATQTRHRIERPHALKIPARRAEYSLTENVASPFQAEPRQNQNVETPARLISLSLVACKSLVMIMLLEREFQLVDDFRPELSNHIRRSVGRNTYTNSTRGGS